MEQDLKRKTRGGATIRDVARLAGVSTATVSYVLNDGPRAVREETRARVLEAMEILQYRPNYLARNLARKHSRTLGVFLHPVNETSLVTNPFLSAIFDGIARAATRWRYDLVLYTGLGTIIEEPPLRNFLDSRVDGLLLVAPRVNSSLVALLPESGLPFVVLSSRIDDPQVSFVTADNTGGAIHAVQHLISLGHRRIAHIAGHPSLVDALERIKGYRIALEGAGLPFDPELVAPGLFTQESGYQAAHLLLQQHPDITAIFAGNDNMAIGAIETLRESGLRVPDEVAIIGFDDISAASVVVPSLTTMRQPMAEIGERATDILIEQIESESLTPSQIILPVELVVRQSTAPPRA